MKYALTILALALSVSSVPAPASAAEDAQSFLASTQQAILGQYALAALARNKASTSTAKSFAGDIASNADKANNWIKAYAKAHGITLPNKPSTVADEQYGQLQGTSGSSFDKTFGQLMSVEAQLPLGDLQTEASAGGDLGTFAKQQLAAMQKFTQEAQKLGQ